MFLCSCHGCSLNAGLMNGWANNAIALRGRSSKSSILFGFSTEKEMKIDFYQADVICLPLNSRSGSITISFFFLKRNATILFSPDFLQIRSIGIQYFKAIALFVYIPICF